MTYINTDLDPLRRPNISRGRIGDMDKDKIAREPMQEWEKRLEHKHAVRDGLMLCNGLDPNEMVDPYGCLMTVPSSKLRMFNGPVFWKHMQSHGHTSTSFSDCACSKRQP